MAALLERRGGGALVVGRSTPGLRTLSVLAAGTSGLTLTRALPPLLLGSTVFVQAHLLLGFLLGPTAVDLLEAARGPALLGAVVVVVALAGVWLVRRRGRRQGAQAWTEACCPLCLAVGSVAERRAEPAPLPRR